MTEQSVRIVNPLGLHARPAAEFVKLASKFASEVRLKRDDVTVNGKSIMGVMTLAAELGSTLVIQAEGQDAEEAVRALTALVEGGFKE